MLVPDNAGLVGNFHLDHRIVFQDNALATQTRFQAGIDGTVNEILFLVGNFFQLIVSLVNVNVAGTTGTNASTVVIQVNVVVFGNFQNGVT